MNYVYILNNIVFYMNLLWYGGIDHSFFQLIRIKRNVVEVNATIKVIWTPWTTYLQYIGDNSHHDVATIDGKNTLRPREYYYRQWEVQKVRHKTNSSFWRIKTGMVWHRDYSGYPDKKLPWTRQTNAQPDCSKSSRQVIPIKNYHGQDQPMLNQIVLNPVVEVEFKESFISLFCSRSRVFLERETSWSGYMSVNADGQLGENRSFVLKFSSKIVSS